MIYFTLFISMSIVETISTYIKTKLEASQHKLSNMH